MHRIIDYLNTSYDFSAVCAHIVTLQGFFSRFHTICLLLIILLSPLTAHSAISVLSAHIYTHSHAHCNMPNPSITTHTQSAVSPRLSFHITEEIDFDLAAFLFYLLLIIYSVYACL